MFVRIVKMSFHLENISKFESIFDAKKELIRANKGCHLLELYQDQQQPGIFFTYSYWDTPQDLENYRNSDLFKKVWADTKALFNDKPQAWSVAKKVVLA